MKNKNLTDFALIRDPETGRIVKNLCSREHMVALSKIGRAAQSHESKLARANAALPKLLAAASLPHNQLKRLAGVRKSEKVKSNMRAVQSKFSGVAVRNRPDIFSLSAADKHIAAISWRLRDPSNRTHEFKNLAHFIRTNISVFDLADVEWTRRGNSNHCLAYSGLASLRPYDRQGNPRKRVEGSWKGWRWISMTEQLPNA